MPADRSALERLHTRIEESNQLSADDKDALLRFSEELGVHNYSLARRIKLLQHCTLLAGDSEKYDPDELPDPDIVDILGDSKEARENAKNTLAGSMEITRARNQKETIGLHFGCLEAT